MNPGEKIKALRIARGMTLEELGDRIGVGKSTVRKWETGEIANMRRDKIAKLADALDTSPLYIVGVEDPAAVPGSGKVQEASELFAQLTDEEQRMMLAQMRGVLSSRKDDSK